MALFILLINNKNLSKERGKLKKLREREELLYTDTLTNVKNRNHYVANIKDTINEQPYPQSLIIADMNNLKTVNDKYGHQLGDELLKIFSNSLMECCSKDSYIYRMGGDEFCIILFKQDGSCAERIILKIREYLSKNGINIGETKKIMVSVAFGYSVRENNLRSIEEVEKEADERMYKDKINTKK